MEPDKASGQTEEKEGKVSDALRQMIDLGAAEVKSSSGTVHILTIVGQIEGHQVLPENTKATKYEHILPLLAAVEENEEIDGLLILLNTVGGDIEAGLAIAELVAGMKKPTVSLVLGGGHSIGVPLAVSAKVSMIAPSASMTIHPVRVNGMVIAAPQTVRYFQRIQERIVAFVGKNSHMAEEKFRQLMFSTDEMAADLGSILYGSEAVQLGLIDRLGTLSDALECLHGMIAQRKENTAQP